MGGLRPNYTIAHYISIYYTIKSPKRDNFLALCANHVTAEGVSMNDFFANEDVSTYGKGEKWDAAQYEALLTSGEQVTSVLEEMIKLDSARLFKSGF
ncbi:hypothetical protein ACS0TY_007921 [Phlomoides rotata]